MKSGVERKVRSDKKRDVKPTLSLELKECIYRISYITNKPVKDIGRDICERGINSRKIIEGFSSIFRRNYVFENTFFIGDLANPSQQKRTCSGLSSRITIRFEQPLYEEICNLSFSMNVTPSRGTAILLESCILEPYFIDKFIKEYLVVSLSEGRLEELKKVMNYINSNSDYDDNISWSAILSYLVDEMKYGASSLNDAIKDLVEKFKG